MKKYTLVVLLIALAVLLTGCSQKKIDELTASFNAEKESLAAAAQEKLDAVPFKAFEDAGLSIIIVQASIESGLGAWLNMLVHQSIIDAGGTFASNFLQYGIVDALQL